MTPMSEPTPEQIEAGRMQAVLYCVRIEDFQMKKIYTAMRALERPSDEDVEQARSIYEQGFKDGFVDATVTEDGFPDEATVLKRCSGVNIAEGWDAYRDKALATLGEAGQ